MVLQVRDATPVQEAGSPRLDAGALLVAGERLDILDVCLTDRVRNEI